MPLVVVDLFNSIKSVFEDVSQNQKTSLDAAKGLAGAYNSYASTAMAGVATPIFTGAEEAIMTGTLAAVLTPMGAAATFAMALQNAILSYWLAPPVNFIGTHPGMVTVAPGVLTLGASLTSVLSNPMNTIESAAQQMATLIDVATKTVIVTFFPPPPIPPPPPPMPIV